MNTYVGKPQTIKKVNEGIVLNSIASSPGISQVQIAENTGLSLQTINKVVRNLEGKGMVVCTGISTYTGGRRARVYEVNENKGYMVCIYIQGEQFHCKITNIMEKEIFARVYEKDPKQTWTENLLKVLEWMAEKIDRKKIEIIGIAVPGTVTNGRIFNIPAILEWEGADLKQTIARYYPCTVWIENDIKSATMGACSKFLRQDLQNMAYISILDHIGAAMIINRKLYNSKNCFSGELAYMALGEHEREASQCGCADIMLANALKEEDTEKKREKLILLAARMLVNICCVIDPDLMVVATPHLTPEDIPDIRREIAKYIQEDYIPALIVDKVIAEKNLDGIISICRSKLEAAVQIVKA